MSLEAPSLGWGALWASAAVCPWGMRSPPPEFPNQSRLSASSAIDQFTQMVLNTHLLSLGAACKTMRNFLPWLVMR